MRPNKTGSVDSPRTMLRWTNPAGWRANAWGRPWCSPSRFQRRETCAISPRCAHGESRAPSSPTVASTRRYAADRFRLAVCSTGAPSRQLGFVESTVAPGSLIVTDDWSGRCGLGKRGHEHFAVAECGDPEVAEQYLPIIHLVFANLKTWLIGIHHGVSHQHLQAYLNELLSKVGDAGFRRRVRLAFLRP